MTPNTATDMDKIMTPEQFTQVVEAILAGKYSWACVLILRFAGYNPLHYIPYRTYNRLTKENHASLKTKIDLETHSSNQNESHTRPSSTSLSNIRDLNYLEPINHSVYNIKGGHCYFWSTEFDLN